MGKGSLNIMVRGRNIKDMRAFDDAIHKIMIWAHNATQGLQYNEIELFIDAVFFYSGLKGDPRRHNYRPLHEYFQAKKDVIREHLLKNYGSQAAMMANNIHYSIYDKPWHIESARQDFMDIYTAITSFAQRHIGDVEDAILEVEKSHGFLNPATIGEKLRDAVVEDVQIVLKHMQDPVALKSVEEDIKDLYNALTKLFEEIERIADKELHVPLSKIREAQKFVIQFDKAIMKKVRLEIQAKEALLPAA